MCARFFEKKNLYDDDTVEDIQRTGICTTKMKMTGELEKWMGDDSDGSTMCFLTYVLCGRRSPFDGGISRPKNYGMAAVLQCANYGESYR